MFSALLLQSQYLQWLRQLYYSHKHSPEEEIKNPLCDITKGWFTVKFAQGFLKKKKSEAANWGIDICHSLYSPFGDEWYRLGWFKNLIGLLLVWFVLVEHSASNWLLLCSPPSPGPTKRSRPTPSPSSMPSSWKRQRTDGRSELSRESETRKATSSTALLPPHHGIELSPKLLENNRHHSLNNIWLH